MANKNNITENPIQVNKSRNKVKKAKTLKNSRKRFYYSMLTLLLIVCVIQAVRGVYLNVTKYIVLNKQINKLESLNQTAKAKNLELKKQIQSYTSSKGIEALARDNLKMVGEDEILVVIKDPPPAPKKNKSALKQIIKLSR